MGRGLSASELGNELNVSVKTIETHQMRMKEKLGVRSAGELRQKAREWLTRFAVNRIREEPEPEQANGCGPDLRFEGTAVSARGYSDLVLRIRSDALLHDSPHLSNSTPGS
jgi:Bacterial regulatory proteins, luxR family